MNKIATLLALVCTFTITAFSAEYVLDNTPELTKKLEASVEAASKEFNFAIRGIARKRLRQTTKPYDTLRLDVNGDTVLFERNGKDPVTATVNGDAVPWLKDYMISFTRRDTDNALVQKFAAEDGDRENVYRFGNDARLLFIDVKIISPKLDKPVTFTLQYKEKSR